MSEAEAASAVFQQAEKVIANLMERAEAAEAEVDRLRAALERSEWQVEVLTERAEAAEAEVAKLKDGLTRVSDGLEKQWAITEAAENENATLRTRVQTLEAGLRELCERVGDFKTAYMCEPGSADVVIPDVLAAMEEGLPRARALLADEQVGERCCLCREPIEEGFAIHDDDGNVYCEGCWQP